MNQTRRLSATDLVDMILELEKMLPDHSAWCLDELAWNPPRYVRLQQIESLLNALFMNETSISVSSFLSGDFITERKFEEYNGLTQNIKDYLKSKYIEIRESDEVRTHELIFLYSRLIDFKRKLKAIHNFNSDLMEANYVTILFSYQLTSSISHSIKEIEKEVDEYLEQLINPKNFSFTEEELIAQYNYPTKDPIKLDIEHM